MSEEEKQAIDMLQNVIADTVIGAYCTKICEDEELCKNDDCWIQKCFDTIVNLIEKQSKEIEEKQTIIYTGSEKVKGLEKEIEELKEQNINLVQEKMINENSTKSLPNFYDYYDVISKQKIKDKIEELENEIKNERILPMEIIEEQNKNIRYKIEILQELLESEE